MRTHCVLNDIEIGLSFFQDYADNLCTNFKIDNYNRELISQLIWYFNGDPKFKVFGEPGDLRKGILLIGEPGTGKTMLMKIFQEFVKHDELWFLANGKKVNMSFPIFPCNDIVKDFETNGHDVTSKYSMRRILCFDDLGEEKKEAVYFGSRENIMQTLIESRYQNPVITLATTNYPIETLAEMYGDRVKSRIHEMFNIMILPGVDRRIV